MKYCIKCGTELSENAKFCSECGAKLWKQKNVITNNSSTISNGKNAKKPFYYRWWFWTIVAIFLLIIIAASSPTSSTLTKNEKKFVEVYEEYVEPTLENPESIEITSISEYTDEKGGIVVFFGYKYTTDVGYTKDGDSLYVVTNTITVDAHFIDLPTYSTIYDEQLIEKYNGKSVETGFIVRSIDVGNFIDKNQILGLWKRLQASSEWGAYNLDRINNAIK